MLKSLATQFAATLFFGPLGLAYSSIAAAVFLTLILAVLFFTDLGSLSVLLIWPVSILTGLVFVKLHNDQIKSSGASLLLGPDEEPDAISTFGSSGRGVAVLAVLAVGGYLAYSYSTSKNEADANANARDRVVDTSTTDSNLTGSVAITDQADKQLNLAETFPLEVIDTSVSAAVSAGQSESDFATSVSDITATEQVVIGTSSQPVVRTRNLYYVDSELVNLREGPGTNFSILSQVARGEELSEIDRAGSWIHVVSSDSNATGWIFNRLVSTEP